jgi:THH1/TOM1/TOM3 domain
MSYTEQLNEASQILLVIMTGLFAGAFVLLLALMLYVLYKRSWSIAVAVICLTPWPILARLIVMALNVDNAPQYLEGSLTNQTGVEIILGGAPNYLFFSSYLLLFLFWAVLYHRAHESKPRFLAYMKAAYIAVNAAVYSVWIVLVALLLTLDERTVKDIVHPIEAVYSASLNVFAGIGFLIYGTRLYLTMKRRRVAIASRSRLEVSQKILRLTVVLSVIFVLRSALILVQDFVLLSALQSLCIQTFYTLFCELAPAVIITVVLFNYVPSQRSAARHKYRLPGDSSYGGGDEDMSSSASGAERRYFVDHSPQHHFYSSSQSLSVGDNKELPASYD